MLEWHLNRAAGAAIVVDGGLSLTNWFDPIASGLPRIARRGRPFLTEPLQYI